MQFFLKRKTNSVKETPGSDLLYKREYSQFVLSGCSPHSPIAGDGRCSIGALMTVGNESFKVAFTYADYSSEPFMDFKTGKPYEVAVQDGDQTLILKCYRIEAALMDAPGSLTAHFDEQSFADSKPSFTIWAGDKQLGGRWTLQSPTKEDFIYAVQRAASRLAA